MKIPTDYFFEYSIYCDRSSRFGKHIGDHLSRDRNLVLSIACMNPHSFVEAERNINFKESLKGMQLLVADGVGVTLIGRLLLNIFYPRITGFDVFLTVMESLNNIGGSVGFVGSTNENLDAIKEQINRDYSNVKVTCLISPPFKRQLDDHDFTQIASELEAASCDVVWVGMTAPKQELLISNLNLSGKVKIIGAIGAVFDFYSGNVTRSPAVFRRMGLEWLPRLLKQPRKLWRRTFVSAPLFVYLSIKMKLCNAQ